MAFDCPKCGSEQTQKVSVIYESGTTAVETKSSGMGVGLTSDGGLVPAIGGGTTKGVQQSDLAKRLAPPGKQEWAMAIGCAPGCLGMIGAVVLTFVAALLGVKTADGGVFAACLILGFLLVFIPAQVLGIGGAWLAYRFNRDEWPKLYAEWDRQWLCHRCGDVFHAEPAQTGDKLSPA